MKTSRLFLVTVLITTIVAGVRLSSVLLAAQTSGPAASDESELLKGFAEIQPIDVHTHIYKDDPELNALIERLSLRAVNICVIDDRDPDFKGLEPQGQKFSRSGKVLGAASHSAPRSARMRSKNRGSVPTRFASSTKTSPMAPWR